MRLPVWFALLRWQSDGGTDRYRWVHVPFVPEPKKIQIGTTPFRGVPFVPRLKTDTGSQFND